LRWDESGILTWSVDASFAVHMDMRSHTGMALTLGRGALISGSYKQKINTKSSTESELVGVDDDMPFIMWIRLFTSNNLNCILMTILRRKLVKRISYCKIIRVPSNLKTMEEDLVVKELDISIFDVFTLLIRSKKARCQ
jgi:hypothetical protein